MLETIVAIFILLSLIMYALMGGADFGGGMWDLLATGPRAKFQRKAIADAIGPIWEANHVWLILVIVLLFTGFPRGFATMMTALNIPLTAMLIGIVLRGTAFVFRKYDSQTDMVHQRWSTLFGVASFFTPFTQGMTLGALATGRIRVESGQLISGFFAGWLTPFALACGLFALGLFAFLAATYLTLDTKDEPGLQNDFRLRALWSGLALGPISLAVFLTSKTGAPAMYAGLTRWWARCSTTTRRSTTPGTRCSWPARPPPTAPTSPHAQRWSASCGRARGSPAYACTTSNTTRPSRYAPSR